MCGENGPVWSRSAPVDGFRLAFDRFGTRGAPAVVLLHGWPGNRHDFRRVVSILGGVADIIVPDLRGFGGSDKHEVAVSHFYSATAQASSIVGLIKELGLSRVVVAGYDVGSRVAQSGSDASRSGAGPCTLSPAARGRRSRAHRAGTERILVSGLPPASAVCAADRWQSRCRPEYLRHFWNHWSGPHSRSPTTSWTPWCRTTLCRVRSPHRSRGTARAPE